jgi:hypothetical protein
MEEYAKKQELLQEDERLTVGQMREVIADSLARLVLEYKARSHYANKMMP